MIATCEYYTPNNLDYQFPGHCEFNNDLCPYRGPEGESNTANNKKLTKCIDYQAWHDPLNEERQNGN